MNQRENYKNLMDQVYNGQAELSVPIDFMRFPVSATSNWGNRQFSPSIGCAASAVENSWCCHGAWRSLGRDAPWRRRLHGRTLGRLWIWSASTHGGLGNASVSSCGWLFRPDLLPICGYSTRSLRETTLSWARHVSGGGFGGVTARRGWAERGSDFTERKREGWRSMRHWASEIYGRGDWWVDQARQNDERKAVGNGTIT
jgi:hypothetical protein